MSAMTEFFNEVDKLAKEYEDEIGLEDSEFIQALIRIGYKYTESFTKERT